MTLIVFTMWWLVVVPTVRGFFHGTLFDAPCLSALPEDYTRKMLESQRKINASSTLERGDAGEKIEGRTG